MPDAAPVDLLDTRERRKARGAFFTPDAVTRFITQWAVRTADDRLLEPSTGDAAFLVEAVHRLRELSNDPGHTPVVDGVEIHPPSAADARRNVEAAGGAADIVESDFFLVEPRPRYDAVIGNPPYIRYQDFSGLSRQHAREAALRAGVSLTALASSWAAFTVHSALFLRKGGRLGLVLPAELLSVNYAGSIRRFLLERFREVELVLFGRQVFPEAEADVVLLLADGFDEGPTEHATIHQADDAQALGSLSLTHVWRPSDPSAKWTALLLPHEVVEALDELVDADVVTPLETWGDTTLGMVTGNNKYFTLTPRRVTELGLTDEDLVRLSPPGSSHLRGLELTDEMLLSLGQQDRATWLFRPGEQPSRAALGYIDAGHRAGVDQAYKCRVRRPWFRVPLVPAADLLLTCMNSDTPRLTTNTAGVHHLNSVHGVYLKAALREVGRELLPVASLNSITVLSAEIVGRSYGGGILKIEPREADVWLMPSVALVVKHAAALREAKVDVLDALRSGDLAGATWVVDGILFADGRTLGSPLLDTVRAARAAMARRRTLRGRRGR